MMAKEIDVETGEVTETATESVTEPVTEPPTDQGSGTTPTAPGSNVIQRINAIMDEMDGVSKNSAAEGLRYKYRGIEDITKTLRPLMAKHGVVIVPLHTERETHTFQNANNKAQNGTYLASTWRIYGAEGDFIEAATFGEAFDSGDKSVNKAMTAAFKYVLLQTFTISDPDEDPDAKVPEGTRTQAQPAGSQRTQQASTRRSSPAQQTTRLASSPGQATTAQAATPGAITPAQVTKVSVMFSKVNILNRDDRLNYVSAVLGRKIGSVKDLTSREGSQLIEALTEDEKEAVAFVKPAAASEGAYFDQFEGDDY